jgi:hypothetical protein
VHRLETGESSARRTRSRFVREPAGGLRLEARDVRLLTDLFLHQAMSREQIVQLGYFTGVNRCNRRLRQLFDHGYVKRHFLPEAPYGAQATYTIGRAAVPVVATALDRDREEVKNLCERGTPAFLTHTLAIVEFRIRLHHAAMALPGVEIERWLPEMLCRDEFEVKTGGAGGGTWRTEVFRPDGFVRLHHPGSGGYRNFFVEIDLGHTSQRQFVGKLRTHRHYLEGSLFADQYGTTRHDRFHTLVVTTGEVRLANLCALVDRERSDLFWFTTFEAVRQSGALAAAWRVPGDPAPRTLLS